MELVIKRFDELTAGELYAILRARATVFVVEQNCAYQDIDDKDQGAYHVFLHDAAGVQAYVRVLDQGVSFAEVSIGRVLTRNRGAGLGRRILLEGIRVAAEHLHADKIRIGAQVYAKAFYEKVGFRQVSEEYLEDEIPHIEMMLNARLQ